MSQQDEFRIEQWSQYVGNDRWKWSCWIDAEPEPMSRISSVTWILHPTFSPSRITLKTRENQFRLDSSGWGTFTLRAKLDLTGGSSLELRRALKLDHPESDVAKTLPPASPPHTSENPGRGPKVFLSYSSEYEKQANELNKIICDQGGAVLLAKQASAGQPLEAAVQKMIRESDAFVTIQSEDYNSHWVMLETKIAHAEGKPILSIPTGHDGTDTAVQHEVQMQVASFVKNIDL